MLISKWDKRFIELAEYISSWSKDPSTRVGAVITDQFNRVVSVGYNGLPAGLNDDPAILNDRETKYELTVHAEMNAIHFAQRNLYGHTLYTYPFGPCIKCTPHIIQVKISRVVFPKTTNERWLESIEKSKKKFQEADVDYLEIDQLSY